MPGKQVSISRSKEMLPVIEEARRKFIDARTDAQALTRALIRWYYDQQGDSRRAASDRLERKLDELLVHQVKMFEQHDRMLDYLGQMLEAMRGGDG